MFGNWLRSRFARLPKWQALVGGPTYYQAFLQDRPGRALVSHAGPLVGDELRRTEIIDAIASGSKLFVVSSAPGCGKSRFALELARRIGRDQRGWEVRFARHDEAAVRSEIQDLSKPDRLILVVDDAQDCPQLVQLLAAECAAADSRTPVHLVCLVRPYGRAAVTTALAAYFPVGTPVEVELGRPNAKLVRELIDKLIPEVSPHHRDTIRRLVGDSFFATVLLCTAVAQQKKLPQTLSPKQLRDYVLLQPIARAVGELSKPEKALRALAVYAACAPVRPGDGAIRASAATLSGLSPAAVEELEQRSESVGLFGKDERGWLRPLPGLAGDLILEETCLDEQGRPTAFSRELIGQLLERDPSAVIRNCAGVERLLSTPSDVDLVGPVLLERAVAMRPQGRAATLGLLENSRALAQRKPAVIFSLFELLQEQGAVRREPPPQELDDLDNVEVHARNLLLQASMQHVGGVRLALEYACALYLACREYPDIRTALHDTLGNYCRFAVGAPVAHVEAVLDVLEDWVAHPQGEYAELAASLLKGYLGLEAHGFRWEQGALVPLESTFILTDVDAKVRDRAIAILLRCARREDPGTQLKAVQSLQDWPRGYEKLDAALLERWAPQLDSESRALTEGFSKLGATTPHLSVRAAIEEQGWRLWAAQPTFAQRAGGQLLRSVPVGTPYALWKALHAESLPVTTVVPEETIPANDRGAYLTALTDSVAEQATQRAKGLFDELAPLYPDTAAWQDLFASVLRSLPKQPLQPQAPRYLAEFVVRHPEAAWSLVTEAHAAGPVRMILPSVLAELRRHDSARWQTMVQQAQPETHLFDAILRALWVSEDLSPVELAMVTKGLDLDDARAVHRSAQTLLNVPPAAIAPSLRAVLSVLRTLPADVKLWELAIDGFSRWGRPVMAAPPDEEPSSELRAVAGELLMLFRTSGSAVDWSEGPHTDSLAPALAVIAVAVPHTLKAWMREVWYQPDNSNRDGSPLAASWLTAVARLIAESPAKAYWYKQFVEWTGDETGLSVVGALGLAELGDPADPRTVG